MPTPSQIKTIQTARGRLRLTDDQYRMILRNAGGVESSKDLDNRGVEDVMAVLEDSGFDSHPGGRTYWRDKVRARGSACGERMARKIVQLAAGGRYDLAAMVRRSSAGRTGVVEQLLPREAWKLIEALKAIGQREQGAAGRGSGPASTEDPRTDDAAPGTDAGSLFPDPAAGTRWQ